MQKHGQSYLLSKDSLIFYTRFTSEEDISLRKALLKLTGVFSF